jgi:L-lactate dehydrogenase complex protein LldG
MENNQGLFLNCIRTALGKDNEQQSAWSDLVASVDDKALVQVINSRGREEQLFLLQQLIDNAGPLHLTVHVCNSLSEAASCITTVARDSKPEFGSVKEIVIHDHPLLRALQLASLLAEENIVTHLTPSNDPEVRRHTVNAYIGVTAADWAIAESATIVQLTRPGQPRSTSLVPSIHIAVLELANLVATLAEAYALIRQEPDLDSLVLISGPSKTADIEGSMVHGAHGPRAMHLIVLTPEPVVDTRK